MTDEKRIRDNDYIIELLSDSYNSGSIATLDSLMVALIEMGRTDPDKRYSIEDMIAICNEFREMIIEEVESEEDDFFNVIANEFDDDLGILNEHFEKMIEEQEDEPLFDEYGRPVNKVIH